MRCHMKNDGYKEQRTYHNMKYSPFMPNLMAVAMPGHM